MKLKRSPERRRPGLATMFICYGKLKVGVNGGNMPGFGEPPSSGT
jgi:hypothetical protein